MAIFGVVCMDILFHHTIAAYEAVESDNACMSMRTNGKGRCRSKALNINGYTCDAYQHIQQIEGTLWFKSWLMLIWGWQCCCSFAEAVGNCLRACCDSCDKACAESRSSSHNYEDNYSSDNYGHNSSSYSWGGSPSRSPSRSSWGSSSSSSSGSSWGSSSSSCGSSNNNSNSSSTSSACGGTSYR